MLEIKQWLEITGMKVAEERFLNPPPLPYIIFKDETDVSGADNKNCIANRNINIELYSDRIDKVAENEIEVLLNEKSISYFKSRTWIQEEMFFETMYDFNLIEKI